MSIEFHWLNTNLLAINSVFYECKSAIQELGVQIDDGTSVLEYGNKIRAYLGLSPLYEDEILKSNEYEHVKCLLAAKNNIRDAIRQMGMNLLDNPGRTEFDFNFPFRGYPDKIRRAGRMLTTPVCGVNWDFYDLPMPLEYMSGIRDIFQCSSGDLYLLDESNRIFRRKNSLQEWKEIPVITGRAMNSIASGRPGQLRKFAETRQQVILISEDNTAEHGPRIYECEPTKSYCMPRYVIAEGPGRPSGCRELTASPESDYVLIPQQLSSGKYSVRINDYFPTWGRYGDISTIDFPDWSSSEPGAGIVLSAGTSIFIPTARGISPSYAELTELKIVRLVSVSSEPSTYIWTKNALESVSGQIPHSINTRSPIVYKNLDDSIVFVTGQTASGSNNLVRISPDEGRTWEEVDFKTNLDVRPIGIGKNTHLYTIRTGVSGRNVSLRRTTNNFESYTEVMYLENDTITALCRLCNGSIIAGTASGQLFISNN